eukprot:TRINITY_DN16701_c0_g1_i1.p1 TRINITY_DN16701_c0_g1~~TRINITY_DN16701_c0_g1_i1.p1  ORF type:complete len:714 (-),score=194.32 TRINITY_DN16701_c0_g1_i1:220-2361(-)
MAASSFLKSIRIPVSRQEFLLKVVILIGIYMLAFFTRLFSVLRYESVIHEYDPYFNYRSTKYLVSEGVYNFINWFDSAAWYPLGRIVGGTVYPGLMMTAASVYWILNYLNITIQIRNVCVLLAPWFASNTAMAAYLFGKEVRDTSTGIISAALIAIVPGYISRSVAGSFDNEGIAIFALVFTYYLWVKSVNTGSLFYSCLCALSYFYMVSAWGGYVFIINLIPIHVFVLLVTGRFSHRLYVAYTSLYVLGTLLSMQIYFVGFQPVQSSEHMAAAGVFGLVQLVAFVNYIRSMIPEEQFKQVQRFTVLSVVGAAAAAVSIGLATGYISPFTGRFYSLLDPSYAKNNIPIIASVSEHQPTTWASFFFDLHFMVFMFPAGLYFCFKNLTDANIFVIIYGVSAVYFAGVMVRLMLVLAPIACILSAIALSTTLKTYMAQLRPKRRVDTDHGRPTGKGRGKAKLDADDYPFKKEIAFTLVVGITVLLIFYAFHCAWVTSEAYSSPSIVLAARQHDGSRLIFDDFREAYWWLRQNTPEDARIMSWWDYGYQISGMANRTVLVDNNTWNNTHIAQVGKAMSSTEDVAYGIMRRLDVDYVLVIFGGLIGYASDDINKFLWMVRIAGSVDPSIQETDYFAKGGDFRVDHGGSKTLLDSLIYKLCYYGYGQVYTEHGKPTGYDRVRNVEIGNKDFELQYVDEAFTSEHWLVRVYKVKDQENRA